MEYYLILYMRAAKRKRQYHIARTVEINVSELEQGTKQWKGWPIMMMTFFELVFV